MSNVAPFQGLTNHIIKSNVYNEITSLLGHIFQYVNMELISNNRYIGVFFM